MPRFFTLAEAETQLPRVERLLRTCLESKRVYGRADAELTVVTQRISFSGGLEVARDEVQQMRRRKDTSARRLKSAVERIQSIGCHLKDLDIGLIDFPTLYHGEEVYLCWKLGEPAIQFWHPVADGFRGRRPIDRDFLAHHTGGETA